MAYPIEDIIPEIRSKLQSNTTVIVQAPPGAGKSTVLPLALMNEPFLNGKKIIMLEPRRLAARTVAQRMAEQLGEKPGEQIGYRIRFESVSSADTRIEVITEGILSSMLRKDPALEEVGMIIFDEFHERSIHADLGLTLSLQLQNILREDLRLLVMSATLDTEKLVNILKAPLVVSEGRTFPVEIIYEPEDKSRTIPENASIAVKRASEKLDGDILVFLPGEGEIKKCAELLESSLNEVIITPLFGNMDLREQRKAILPDENGFRKIVLATSIAETSLTIEGVKVVIDSGYTRSNRFDPGSGMNKLVTARVTKDVADQRAGRAGRTAPGVCIRLWSKVEQQSLNPSRKPEIEETDLSPLLLDLAAWGDAEISSYSWITQPPAAAVKNAMELLEELGSMVNNKITERGKKMSVLPAHPRISHMLLEADERSLPLAIDIAVLLEERDPLGKEHGSNLAERAEALRRYRSNERVAGNRSLLEKIDRSANAWARIFRCKTNKESFDDHDAGALLAFAYPDRIARRADGTRYRLSSGKSAFIDKNDPLLQEEWICIATLDTGRENPRIWYSAPIGKNRLSEYASRETNVSWNKELEMIECSEQLKIGALVLESKPSRNCDEGRKKEILLEVISGMLEKLISQDKKCERLIARVSSLRKWNAEEEWPDMSVPVLQLTMNEWLEPYLKDVRKKSDIEKLDLFQILHNSLSWKHQQKLSVLAPEKIEVPTGSLITIEYSEDGSAPVLAVRLQEMFGLFETPRVNNGKNPVMLHLLSPGYKPVQVTQDLNSFWKRTYSEVRKELRMRYPKHHWPEDPFTAKAVRGPRKN